MAMETARLLWVGAAEKGEQSGVGIGGRRAELLSGSMVCGISPLEEVKKRKVVELEVVVEVEQPKRQK